MEQDASKLPSVLLVDDHQLICEALSQLIELDGHFRVCGRVGSVREARQAIREHKPNLVLLDLSLGDGSGLELLPEIRKLSPRTQVLVLSMHDEMIFAERCLRAGARGYVSKAEVPARIVEALHRIAKGDLVASDTVKESLLRRVSASAGRASSAASPVEHLTNRELQVFMAIGRGLTTQQIAKDLTLSGKTIQTYRDRIKQKLQIPTANELIRRAVHWVSVQQDA